MNTQSIEYIFWKFKNLIQEKIDQWKNKKEILNHLNIEISKSNLKKIRKFIRNNIKKSDFININELKEICKSSYSYSEVLWKLNIKKSWNSFNKLKNIIQKNNIEVWHFTWKLWNLSPNQNLKNIKYQRSLKSLKYNLNEVFCNNSQVRQKILRTYIQKFWLLEYKCQKCWNIWFHNWEKLTLEIDHIDWNNKNNSLNNLRYLCPNCHSQTPTFKSKNIKNKNTQ